MQEKNPQKNQKLDLPIKSKGNKNSKKKKETEKNEK